MPNTPNTWGIYLVNLVCEWLKGKGRRGGNGKEKRGKSENSLRRDRPERRLLSRTRRKRSARSLMNVTFRLPSEDLENQFVIRSAVARLGRIERTPQRRRNPRFDLQRFSEKESNRVEFMTDFAQRMKVKRRSIYYAAKILTAHFSHFFTFFAAESSSKFPESPILPHPTRFANQSKLYLPRFAL
jgi:phosphoserine aminotransferase